MPSKHVYCLIGLTKSKHPESSRRIADSLVITEYRLESFQQENFRERIYVGDEQLQVGMASNITTVVQLEEEITSRSVQKEYYDAN